MSTISRKNIILYGLALYIAILFSAIFLGSTEQWPSYPINESIFAVARMFFDSFSLFVAAPVIFLLCTARSIQSVVHNQKGIIFFLDTTVFVVYVVLLLLYLVSAF